MDQKPRRPFGRRGFSFFGPAMRHRESNVRNAEGFSVIELGIVLAVSMLVGVVGVSAYRTYAVRAQVSAGILQAEQVQARVAAAFRRIGEAPADRTQAGMPGPASDDAGELLEGIDVVDGRLAITFGGRADSVLAGRTLYLTPFETANLELVWVCGNKVPGVGLHPMGFAGGGRATTQLLTVIDARYLPSSCR